LVITGTYCTEDVNECTVSNPCQNGGTCENRFGGFYCVCVSGWTGFDCSVNIDDCADRPCYNGGTCHDRVASFYCECPRGKTGNYPTSYSVIQLMRTNGACSCSIIAHFSQVCLRNAGLVKIENG